MKVNIEKEIVEVDDKQRIKKRWLYPIDVEKEYGWSRSWQSKSRMSTSKISLPYKKVGKFIIYDRYEIDAFIEEHTVVGGK